MAGIDSIPIERLVQMSEILWKEGGDVKCVRLSGSRVIAVALLHSDRSWHLLRWLHPSLFISWDIEPGFRRFPPGTADRRDDAGHNQCGRSDQGDYNCIVHLPCHFHRLYSLQAKKEAATIYPHLPRTASREPISHAIAAEHSNSFQRDVEEQREKITIAVGRTKRSHGLAGMIPRFYGSEDRTQSGSWNREFLNIHAPSTHKKHGTFCIANRSALSERVAQVNLSQFNSLDLALPWFVAKRSIQLSWFSNFAARI
jgi:hypothetical protein